MVNQYGPITVGVYASHSRFRQAGKTGVIHCPAGRIDHAVLLVGYTRTHWIVKNSWGTSWGDNGYGYIPKSNDCGLSRYVNVAIVNFKSRVSSTSPLLATSSASNSINLTIIMTDSSGDGWNGNVLLIRQD